MMRPGGARICAAGGAHLTCVRTVASSPTPPQHRFRHAGVHRLSRFGGSRRAAAAAVRRLLLPSPRASPALHAVPRAPHRAPRARRAPLDQPFPRHTPCAPRAPAGRRPSTPARVLTAALSYGHQEPACCRSAALAPRGPRRAAAARHDGRRQGRRCAAGHQALAGGGCASGGARRSSLAPLRCRCGAHTALHPQVALPPVKPTKKLPLFGASRAPCAPQEQGAHAPALSLFSRSLGFVDQAETINSRAAMIGFFALLLVEAVRHLTRSVPGCSDVA